MIITEMNNKDPIESKRLLIGQCCILKTTPTKLNKKASGIQIMSIHFIVIIG